MAEPTDKASSAAFSLKTKKVLLDDDAMLTAEDKEEKTKRAAEEGDCTTRRRACKNCVCGRAELEAKAAADGVVLDGDDDGPPTGGCGSCAKGDAFRCARCPYLGKPAWNNNAEEGKVQLDLMDDM